MCLLANLRLSAPYGSDFSLALRAVLGARIPAIELARQICFWSGLAGEDKGDLGVLFGHEKLEPRAGSDKVDLGGLATSGIP
jgi:hypothetical protein